MAQHIVKRRGHTEPYDARKLYASIYASVLAVRYPARAAETLAEEVTEKVEQWLDTKHEVTTNDIRRVAGEKLLALNKDAGLQFIHHRILW